MERAQQVLEDLRKQIGSGEQGPVQEALAEKEVTSLAVEVHEPRGAPLQTLGRLINPLLGPLATTAIIIVFVIFILVMREDLRDRLIRLAGSTDIPHATAAIDDAARRLSRLFLAQLAINAVFGILIGFGLYFIGIPSSFVWGVLAGILRFIPFIGPILGLIFPMTLAVSVDPGWSMALWTIVLFLGARGRHEPAYRTGDPRPLDWPVTRGRARSRDLLGLAVGAGRRRFPRQRNSISACWHAIRSRPSSKPSPT